MSAPSDAPTTWAGPTASSTAAASVAMSPTVHGGVGQAAPVMPRLSNVTTWYPAPVSASVVPSAPHITAGWPVPQTSRTVPRAPTPCTS